MEPVDLLLVLAGALFVAGFALVSPSAGLVAASVALGAAWFLLGGDA